MTEIGEKGGDNCVQPASATPNNGDGAHSDGGVADLEDILENGIATKPIAETKPTPTLFNETQQPTASKPKREDNGAPQRFTEWLTDGSVRFSDGEREIVTRPSALREEAKPIGEIEDLSIHIANLPQLHETNRLVLDIETNHETGEIIAVGWLEFSGNEVTERSIYIVRNSFRDFPLMPNTIPPSHRELGNIAGWRVYAAETESILLELVIGKLKEKVAKWERLVIVGYNILNFDLPHLLERAKTHGILVPYDYAYDENRNQITATVAATEGIVSAEPIKVNLFRWQTQRQPQVVDVFLLVARYDAVARELPHHDLKYVASHFKVAVENRPELSPADIVRLCNGNRDELETFVRYLGADLEETNHLYEKLAPPYHYIAEIVNNIVEAEGKKVLPITFSQATYLSTAAIVERLLEAHYGKTDLPKPDEKIRYEGGLVVCREGMFHNAAKLDVASLYPSIMLAYRIHSRKDHEGWMLKVLKWLTERRLEYKAKAKAGDAAADALQQSLKVLINSVYGFYGTGGYPFNDMSAAAEVTRYGRELLTLIIATIEDLGGVVIEADTDGVIFSHPDPEAVEKAVNEALPAGFKVELEFSGAAVFVSDRKNYIVRLSDGSLILKGAKWRGRDKPAMVKDCIVQYIVLHLEGKHDEAENYISQVKQTIAEGGEKGWNLVCVTRKVGKNDKFLKNYGKEEGERVTYAYKDKKSGAVSFSPCEGYDVKFYTKKFHEILGEVRRIIYGR